MNHSVGRESIRWALAASVAIAAQDVAAQSGAPETLETIIVTARKRAETLQEVPLAVSAIDGDIIAAQGIRDVTAVYSRVPNLYFTTAGGASPTSDFQYLVIRGVGFNGGLEPAVGVFIDGMYQPQVGFDIGFLDVERVEVLRGPQGTLFGRNTQAGALNIVTKKPGQSFEGRVEVEAAEFATYRLQGAVSGPLSDTLSGALNVQYAESDGFSDNLTLGTDQGFYEQAIARGTLRWTPSDVLDATLIADWTQKDFSELALGSPLSCRCYDNFSDQDADDSKDSVGVQLNIDWKLTDAMTFTSITGSRQVESDITYDWDGAVTDQTPLTLSAVTQTNSPPIGPISVASSPVIVRGVAQRQLLEQEFVSQELRLAGATERLDWLVGAYYFDQSILQPRFVDIGPGVPFVPLYIRERFTEDRDGWAAFGQLTFRPIDRLELTLGTRYSDESVEVGGERVLNVADASIFAFLKSGELSTDNVSSMASVSWDLSDTALIYASWSQGWKAGGINRYPSRVNANLSYEDEESTNTELGLKASWLDGRLVTNLAVFNIDIEQQQVLNVIPDPNGVTPVTVIANAGQSTVKGVEAEITAKFTESLELDVAYGYTDTEFDEFIQFGVDRAGDEFWFVPNDTLSTTLSYNIEFANERALDVSLNYRFIGSYTIPDGNFNAAVGAELSNESYDRLDLRARLTLASGWRVTGYVRNLADSYDYAQIAREPFLPTVAPETTFVIPLEPRTFGLIVSKTF